jgi:hypothetical protein
VPAGPAGAQPMAKFSACVAVTSGRRRAERGDHRVRSTHEGLTFEKSFFCSYAKEYCRSTGI